MNQPFLSSRVSHDNPLPPLVLLIIVIVSFFLTVLVGGALFFFPEFSQPRWLWPLKPFNTRFLGAIYLAAFVGFFNLLLARRSALPRLIVPMLCVFTTNALMVSCLHLQQFNAGRRATDIWFWLYLVDCVGAAYYWGYYRQLAFGGLRRLPRLWSVGLGVQAGILSSYGLSMLFFPTAIGLAWLWPLDIFHTQLYSSIFLSGAVGAAVLLWQATAEELRTLGMIQVTFSGLVLIGVWVVDQEIDQIDWGLFENWAWIGAIALLGIIGLSLIQQSLQMQFSKQPPGSQTSPKS